MEDDVTIIEMATPISSETIDQLRKAAKAMRALAEGLDRYSNDPELGNLFEISCSLNRIGWNALFTSVLIGDLACAMQGNSDKKSPFHPQEYFEYADALLTAIRYLLKSIETLNVTAIQEYDFDREEVLRTSRELEQRLGEVLHECQSL
jgi:hypothetical protein